MKLLVLGLQRELIRTMTNLEIEPSCKKNKSLTDVRIAVRLPCGSLLDGLGDEAAGLVQEEVPLL